MPGTTTAQYCKFLWTWSADFILAGGGQVVAFLHTDHLRRNVLFSLMMGQQVRYVLFWADGDRDGPAFKDLPGETQCKTSKYMTG